MTSVHVQIFFYGLIAFADRGGMMHALLMQHAGHMPFLIYAAGGCTGDCTNKVTLDNVSYPGWPQLAQEQVEIPPLTAGLGKPQGIRVSGPHGRRRAGSRAPSNAAAAEDFAWVPRMADLQGADFKFDERCVKPGGLTKCKVKLAARMSLQVGPLTTCSLVSALRDCKESGVKPGVNEYTFWPNRHSPTPQALAELVMLAADVPLPGGSLTVTARKPDGSQSRKVMLAGYDCAGGGKCIDLFLGNVTPDKVHCPKRKSGDDFPAYYQFLMTPPSPQDWSIPRTNGFAHPQVLTCPTPPHAQAGGRGASKAVATLKPLFHSAASRPVCSMVVF